MLGILMSAVGQLSITGWGLGVRICLQSFGRLQLVVPSPKDRAACHAQRPPGHRGDLRSSPT
jgi:hypothetical protein